MSLPDALPARGMTVERLKNDIERFHSNGFCFSSS
jgi:hypothetical protein